tara:strand:- start:646 stop:1980 length:1335 start_codon:yes stop_codon:yes gene_type:complete
MLFHSPFFLFLFLPVILSLYFLTSKYSKSAYEYILVFAGIFFYAYWDIFLSPIIIGSIIFNYYFSKRIKEITDDKSKRKLLIIAIIFNIIWLAIFKYTDFIIQNFNILFNSNIDQINLPFPLAISFVTFQTIAHLVDCYNGKIEKNNLVRYSLFIIFFPQLIAGPIVKYRHMMTQFCDDNNRNFNFKNFNLGLIIILIGLFKKIFLADNLAFIVEYGFTNSSSLSFYESWLTSLCFTFQIYFDFSGYIDIATGIALLFNIKLPQNFDSPYKSTSIINFWQRWHITLSHFLTNYIYFPWAKSLKNVNFLNTMIITFLVFVIAGFWHGPSWLYVIFGSLHGLGLVVNHTFRRFLNYRMNSLLACFFTFNYVNITFVFFRSKNIEDALNILKGMFGLNGYSYPDLSNFSIYIILILFLSVIITFVFKNTNYLIENFNSLNLENKISK